VFLKGVCLNMAKTIFVVDDNDTNLERVKEVLEGGYHVFTMPSAAKMFFLLEKLKPDLIMLDIEMPDEDGFDALKRLKANESYKDIPVIFLTGRSDVTSEVLGFELGAVDFITKPFSSLVMQNRIKAHLNIDELIRERTEQLNKLKNGIISVLADVVESRDTTTGVHIENTATYIEIMLKEMLERGVYADEINSWSLDTVISSSRMHDIGKIAISDTILNKPDKLSTAEFDLIKTHCNEGVAIVEKMSKLSGEEDFLQHANIFAVSHHERWDGTGYPSGLKGDDIPLQGRIMAIVDVYDALVSRRPYKDPFTHEDAVKIIILAAGTQFDPKIVAVFEQVHEKFKDVWK